MLRSDGTIITYYYQAPQQASFPILVLLQGSTCTSSHPMFQSVLGPMLQKNIAVLAIEKPGLNQSTSSCPTEYLEKNTIAQRIQDHLDVLKFLKARLSGWNHHVGLAGTSEGGQVAELLAPLVPETTLLVALASGGGISMSQELVLLTKKKLEKQAASANAVTAALTDLQTQFSLMHQNPTSTQEWRSDGKFARNTYKWWDAILEVKALPGLEKLNIPIYLAQGAADTSCPVESADSVAARFRDLGKINLIYKRYPDLEHNFTDTHGQAHPEVLQDAFAWIIDQLH